MANVDLTLDSGTVASIVRLVYLQKLSNDYDQLCKLSRCHLLCI